MWYLYSKLVNLFIIKYLFNKKAIDLRKNERI